MSRTFVFGDIHGCYDEFLELIKQIGITDDDRLVSLGDIVDRGPKSLEVWRFFRDRPGAVVLMGNHERKHLRGVLSYSQEIVKVQMGDDYPAFVEWCNSLPYHLETDDALIVHAFFEHDVPLSEQREEVLAGTTAGSRHLEQKYEEGQYWSDLYTGDMPIIYGHHVVGSDPKIKNNTYGIDTGACHGDRLTAIELPGFAIHQVEVGTDHWKSEQAKWQVPVLAAKDWDNLRIDQIHRQLGKLRYREEPEVKAYLAQLHDWVEAVTAVRERLHLRLQELAAELQEQHGPDFNRVAAALPYRTFLFKARGGNLGLASVEKALGTPDRILELARELGLADLPELPKANT